MCPPRASQSVVEWTPHRQAARGARQTAHGFDHSFFALPERCEPAIECWTRQAPGLEGGLDAGSGGPQLGPSTNAPILGTLDRPRTRSLKRRSGWEWISADLPSVGPPRSPPTSHLQIPNPIPQPNWSVCVPVQMLYARRRVARCQLPSPEQDPGRGPKWFSNTLK